MKIREFSILADQNIHAGVVAFLRGEGFSVVVIALLGLAGVSDIEVLARATAEGRIVLSHDADFGTLTIPQGLPFVGIVYLRPGHVDAQFTIESLQQLLAADPDLNPPFLVVIKRSGDGVKIRVRSVPLPNNSGDTAS